MAPANKGRIARLVARIATCALFCSIAGCVSTEMADTDAARICKDSRQRPNFVFILVDDMRWDVMSCVGHPFVKTPNIDRIAASGARFANTFVTTSLCSPSRASFLTGAYPHTHGVMTNEGAEPAPSCPTFPQVLQKVGYETAFIGKWHMSLVGTPRPGFDYWLSFIGQGEYNNPGLNENGREFKQPGYMTDILTDYAIKFLKRDRDKPFCLYLSHKAMHALFIPPDRHKSLYDPADQVKPESWDDDLSEKPKWLRELHLRGGRLKHPVPEGGIPDAIEPHIWGITNMKNVRRVNWHRTLAAIDEGVGRLQKALRDVGLDDNTVVIFAGDNGFFLGEHGLVDKRLAYEESIRIPLMIQDPRSGKSGQVLDQIALNIDVAPTILDMAGVKIPDYMQGNSLKPLLAGKDVPWRHSFFYKYYKEAWLPGVPTIEAVRTENFKYIRTPELNDIDELYNIKNDPTEMHNLALDPAYKKQLEKMQAELERQIKATKR